MPLRKGFLSFMLMIVDGFVGCGLLLEFSLICGYYCDGVMVMVMKVVETSMFEAGLLKFAYVHIGFGFLTVPT